MGKTSVRETLVARRPDSWLQLAHEAEALVRYHADRADAVKLRYDAPLAERSEVTLAERKRVARRILRNILRDRNTAQHIYLGASAAAFEHEDQSFASTALPQRIQEAQRTGLMLQSFVKAAQTMVVARQMGEAMPGAAMRWQVQAESRLGFANEKLFTPDALRLPLRPLSVLTVIGMEAHGLNQKDKGALLDKINPAPGQG